MLTAGAMRSRIAVSLTLSLVSSLAHATPDDERVANSLLRSEWSARAADESRAAAIASLVAGVPLVLVGAVGCELARERGGELEAAILPWAIEAVFLGAIVLFAGESSAGQPYADAAARMDERGFTTRATLLGWQRDEGHHARTAGGISLGVGLGVTAIAIAALAVGLGAARPGTEETGWISAGGAIGALGLFLDGAGIGLLVGGGREIARSDAGILERERPLPPLIAAPIALRSGGGLALSGSF